MSLQKEAIRRVPPDIVDDARNTYRINKNPTHPDIITVEERSVASDRATCGSCEKVFKKGDKALYIEHHVNKKKNPYHIDRKHVCFDKCKHKDGPAKKEKAKPKPKKKTPSKKEDSKEEAPEKAQSRGDQRQHPCPYVIHGCEFKGNMQQIKKHINPGFQNQQTDAGDPEEVAECFYNRFRNSSVMVRSAHCGHCDETLDFDTDEVLDHIEEDAGDLTELQKRIKEIEDADKEAKEELREGDMSKEEVLDHIEDDGERFDAMIEQLENMKKEDGEFAEELDDHGTYAESSDDYHSTDDLVQFGFSPDEIGRIKNIINPSNNDNIKTAARVPRILPQFNRSERNLTEKALQDNSLGRYKRRQVEKTKKINEDYHTTEQLTRISPETGQSRSDFTSDEIKQIKSLTENRGVSESIETKSRQPLSLSNFGNKIRKTILRKSPHIHADDGNNGCTENCSRHCATCGNKIEPGQEVVDRIIPQNPYWTTKEELLRVIHHKASEPEHRRQAFNLLMHDDFLNPSYTPSQTRVTCSSCPGATAETTPLQDEAKSRYHPDRDGNPCKESDCKHHQVLHDIDSSPADALRGVNLKEVSEGASQHDEVPIHPDRPDMVHTRIEHVKELNESRKRFDDQVVDKASDLRDAVNEAAKQKGFGAIKKVVSRQGKRKKSKRESCSSDYIAGSITTNNDNDTTKFGSFREVSHIDDRLQLLAPDQLEAASRKINMGRNVPVEQWGSSTHIHIPTDDGEEVINTPSLTNAFKSIRIAQDGGGGDGGGGDGGYGGNGGEGASGEGSEGDGGLGEGPHGEGQSGNQGPTIGATQCPRCGGNEFYPVNAGPYYSCFLCGYSALPHDKIKKKHHGSWVDHTEPPKTPEPGEENFDNDTSPVIPQMFVEGDAMRPAPGSQDNKIYNQVPRMTALFNAPMMLVNASVHESAPTIVRHEKVWKRIHKINTPRDGICPRCGKHIDYLGLCNTCRQEVGMQWHHWNAQDLQEGK